MSDLGNVASVVGVLALHGSFASLYEGEDAQDTGESLVFVSLKKKRKEAEGELRSLRHVKTCGHKAKDITPSIAWRREALKEETLDDLP